MLYMKKTRVTYRVAPDLAASLRGLPNQTQFVEDALRNALGTSCPVCEGSGRVTAGTLRVSNLRGLGASLEHDEALQLRRVVRLGRQMAATNLQLERVDGALAFVLARRHDILLRGTLRGSATELLPN